MKTHNPENGPCPPMKPLLDRAADSRAKGLSVWYARAHALRCPGCGRYLQSLQQLVGRLGGLKENTSTDDEAAIERLANRF